MTRKQLQQGWPGLKVELLPGSAGYRYQYRVTGSIEEVSKWERLLCQEYHPAGYGTCKLTVTLESPDHGTVTAHWGHSDSCD